MHPWHDVSLGEDAPRLVNAIVEIPLGSKNKYELDAATGLLRLDRVLSSEVRYPVNYGFFPRTRASDGAALDALVLGQTALDPLTVVAVRPIAVLTMSSRTGREPKILAVPPGDPSLARVHSAAGLGAHRLEEIRQFFRDYKILEGSPVRILSEGGAPSARAEIASAARAYDQAPWEAA